MFEKGSHQTVLDTDPPELELGIHHGHIVKTEMNNMQRFNKFTIVNNYIPITFSFQLLTLVPCLCSRLDEEMSIEHPEVLPYSHDQSHRAQH